MSTTADAGRAVAACRPTEGTPVTVDADAIESTADDYLRALKRRLDREGYVPAELALEADFDPDCSLTTQSEADRVRQYLRAADFLGAGTVRLAVDAVDAETVGPTIAALSERAGREGLTLVVDGPDAHDL